MSKVISASVGRFGINRGKDVAEVQELLNRVAISQGGPVIPIPVNGFCGEQTKAAITNFQMFHLGRDGADGRIDPKSRTWVMLERFECPTKQTGSGLPVTEFNIRPGSEGRFYEVTPASGSGTAVYWIGFPPIPAPAPQRFKGNGIPFQAVGELTVDKLECSATYTTRAVHGKRSSEMVLRLAGGNIRIPMSSHLPTPSDTAVATLAGLFQRVP